MPEKIVRVLFSFHSAAGHPQALPPRTSVENQHWVTSLLDAAARNSNDVNQTSRRHGDYHIHRVSVAQTGARSGDAEQDGANDGGTNDPLLEWDPALQIFRPGRIGVVPAGSRRDPSRQSHRSSSDDTAGVKIVHLDAFPGYFVAEYVGAALYGVSALPRGSHGPPLHVLVLAATAHAQGFWPPPLNSQKTSCGSTMSLPAAAPAHATVPELLSVHCGMLPVFEVTQLHCLPLPSSSGGLDGPPTLGEISLVDELQAPRSDGVGWAIPDRAWTAILELATLSALSRQAPLDWSAMTRRACDVIRLIHGLTPTTATGHMKGPSRGRLGLYFAGGGTSASSGTLHERLGQPDARSFHGDLGLAAARRNCPHLQPMCMFQFAYNAVGGAVQALPASSSSQCYFPAMRRGADATTVCGCGVCSGWLTPMIRGYFGMVAVATNNNNNGGGRLNVPAGPAATHTDVVAAGVILVARVCPSNDGPRYVKRGGNAVGDVANSVESEQVVFRVLRTTSDGRPEFVLATAAFTIYRGSVPLAWSQPVDLRYKPKVRLAADTRPLDPRVSGVISAHFNRLRRHYADLDGSGASRAVTTQQCDDAGDDECESRGLQQATFLVNRATFPRIVALDLLSGSHTERRLRDCYGLQADALFGEVGTKATANHTHDNYRRPTSSSATSLSELTWSNADEDLSHPSGPAAATVTCQTHWIRYCNVDLGRLLKRKVLHSASGRGGAATRQRQPGNATAVKWGHEHFVTTLLSVIDSCGATTDDPSSSSHPVGAVLRHHGVTVQVWRRSASSRDAHASVVVRRRQCGVIRVNCLDCVDRSNLAEFLLARWVFEHLLWPALADRSLVVDLGQTNAATSRRSAGVGDEGPASDFLREQDAAPLQSQLASLWIQHGDAVSHLYAGSGALFTEALEPNGPKRGSPQPSASGLSLRGLAEDGVKALRRYCKNNLRDGLTQDSVSFLTSCGTHAGDWRVQPTTQIARGGGSVVADVAWTLVDHVAGATAWSCFVNIIGIASFAHCGGWVSMPKKIIFAAADALTFTAIGVEDIMSSAFFWWFGMAGELFGVWMLFRSMCTIAMLVARCVLLDVPGLTFTSRTAEQSN